MAKITGPLFSIAASGRIGPVLCFRTANSRTTAIRAPIPSGGPSPPQIAERARLATCATAWRGLDDDTRSLWDAFALTELRNPWISFSREYILQQCAAPALPLIPAAPFQAP
jgi:hypothetical protein